MPDEHHSFQAVATAGLIKTIAYQLTLELTRQCIPATNDEIDAQIIAGLLADACNLAIESLDASNAYGRDLILAVLEIRNFAEVAKHHLTKVTPPEIRNTLTPGALRGLADDLNTALNRYVVSVELVDEPDQDQSEVRRGDIVIDRAALRLTELAERALPRAHRARYREEWRAELYDLAGVSRRAQWRYAVNVLITAWPVHCELRRADRHSAARRWLG